MEYYIQGSAANTDKIKAAFEKLGYDTGHLGFTSSQLYYTIEGKVELMCTKSLQNLIKTHPDYQELPIEPNFKVGDWIVGNEGIFKITQYEDEHGYDLTGTTGCVVHFVSPDYVESNFHIWTIADAKDGDVLATDNGWACIFQAFDGYAFNSYCFMDSQKWFCESGAEGHTLDSRINGNIHPATPKQRTLLFKKMQEAGYQWYAGEKELRKIKPHYDISNFKPKQWVLVRDDDEWEWALTRFSHLSNGSASLFVCINGASFQQCIPFEGNEHLLGTINPCDERFINW